MASPKTLKCNQCKLIKTLDDTYFKKSNTNKYGFRPVCKECVLEYQRRYRKDRSQLLREKRRKHYILIQEKVKLWDLNSKANIKARALIDPAYARKTKQANNARHMGKYKSNIIYKLRHRLRSRISTAVRKGYKTLKFCEYLGCDLQTLKKHLEDQFQPGMSWDNHGNSGWHIDHILPLSAFDLENEEQLRIAGNYKNLQPLWAKDNLIKSNKIVV